MNRLPKFSFFPISLAICVLCSAAPAQLVGGQWSTAAAPFLGGNGQAGNMFDISGNGVVFSAGQTYGIYFQIANYALATGLEYTNGGPTLYSGTHCDLTTHSGNSLNFGSVYTPREWNGILHTELAGPAGPSLSVVGTCGQAGSGMQATNMTPNGVCGFAASPSNAGATVPAGPCGQVQLGLGQPLFVVGFTQADGSGTATVLPSNGIPAVACGWYMQSLDLTSCGLTNVITL